MSIEIKPVRFDALRSLAFGAIGAAFTDLGTALTSVTRIAKVVNTTDADVIISYDGGVNSNDVVPAGGFYLYDEASNGLVFSIGTQFSARRLTVPTSGTLYLVAAHARGE